MGITYFAFLYVHCHNVQVLEFVLFRNTVVRSVLLIIRILRLYEYITSIQAVPFIVFCYNIIPRFKFTYSI